MANLWKLNMVTCGGAGVLTLFKVHMGQSIRKGWPKFADFAYFRVGNGAHLKFW